MPWEALAKLLTALDDLRGIRLARATKVLHKKRPDQIPILDEVVARYLQTYVVRQRSAPSWASNHLVDRRGFGRVQSGGVITTAHQPQFRIL